MQLVLSVSDTVVASVKVTAIDRNGFVLTQGTGGGFDIATIAVTDIPKSSTTDDDAVYPDEDSEKASAEVCYYATSCCGSKH